MSPERSPAEDAVAVAGEVVCGVGECYLLHLADICAYGGAVSKLRYHRGVLLCHELHRPQEGQEK